MIFLYQGSHETMNSQFLFHSGSTFAMTCLLVKFCGIPEEFLGHQWWYQEFWYVEGWHTLLGLTYPPPRQFWRWFSFPPGGICDRFLEGKYPINCGDLRRFNTDGNDYHDSVCNDTVDACRTLQVLVAGFLVQKNKCRAFSSWLLKSTRHKLQDSKWWFRCMMFTEDELALWESLKMVVGKLRSYWKGNCSVAMLNFRRVSCNVLHLGVQINPTIVDYCHLSVKARILVPCYPGTNVLVRMSLPPMSSGSTCCFTVLFFSFHLAWKYEYHVQVLSLDMKPLNRNIVILKWVVFAHGVSTKGSHLTTVTSYACHTPVNHSAFDVENSK